LAFISAFLKGSFEGLPESTVVLVKRKLLLKASELWKNLQSGYEKKSTDVENS